MFTIKKPAIIAVLVILLVITGYINHNLTKQASARVSSDYQNYEEEELAKQAQSEFGRLVPTISEGEDTDDIEILDLESGKTLDDMIIETEADISETISNKESLVSKNYFIEQRLARDKLRAGLIDRLNDIVNNENSSQEMVTEAQRKIMEIGELSEKELTIEGLIKAKGFEEALVFLTVDEAKVVVGKEELTEQDVVKILEIVLSETDLDASDVNIMKKN